MPALIAPSEIRRTAPPARGPYLRVRRAGDDRVRTFHLGQAKCTIGSSPQCQVCLPTADVGPLHCLLSFEAGAATVTRWAKGALLNGREFSKSPLENGHKISIGRWELEFGGWQGQVVAAQAGAERSQPREPKAEAQIQAEVAPLVASTSQAFEDRLVLDLWTKTYQARRRAKALIVGMRAERFQAEALAADLSAMETELDLARAAYDSHLGHQSAIEEQIAEHCRAKEERIASLNENQAALRQRLADTENQLARQIEECRRLTEELNETHAGDALDVSAPAAEAAVREEQNVPPIAAVENDPWQHVHALHAEPQDESEQLSAAASAWGDVSAWGVEPASSSAEAEESSEAAFFSKEFDEVAPRGQEEVEEAAPLAIEQSAFASCDETDSRAEHSPAIEDIAESQEPTTADAPSSPAWTSEAEEAPTTEYQSTSFIDKYRHLLEDDAKTLSPRAGQSLLDEEYLSPKKAVTCATPADDSDEALEAYMENMMRRVRSGGSSSANDQVMFQPTKPATPLTPPGLPAFEPQQPATANAPDTTEPELDFEALMQSVRRPAPATNLAALREIANSSARTAIATHNQRRSHESAMSKIMVALTASCTSAYLMASAPSFDNWQFWAGAGTCTVGIAAAIQVLLLERRRRKGPQANGPSVS